MGSPIGFWGNFAGGHWGNRGPEQSQGNQYGGINMMLTDEGAIAPVAASRSLTVANARTGTVRGMFWAWGADGQVYYVQDGQSATATTSSASTVFRFDPIGALNGPVTQDDVGGFNSIPDHLPDWAQIGTNVYLTIHDLATYKIDTTTGTMSQLTGTYGNAPAGRCIAVYGQRLVIGGISDGRFGVQANRICFSGDDTNNNPSELASWETLNYFDLGADGTAITGLYPLRDHLVVFLADQQVYLISGVLGASAVARRIYGFDKGSGAITAYVHDNAATDPSQVRLWMYDHANRTGARFDGASLSRVEQFGAPHANRTATDIFEGTMTTIGGPDEWVMNGIATTRAAGEGVTNAKLGLMRINGAYVLVDRDVIGVRSDG